MLGKQIYRGILLWGCVLFFVSAVAFPVKGNTIPLLADIQPAGLRNMLADTGRTGFPDASPDTLSRKRQRELKKKAERAAFKKEHDHYTFNASYVFANLDTEITFSGPNNVLQLVLGLESTLELPRRSGFLSGSFLWRLTPHSGLYFNYYGLNRNNTFILPYDIVWQGDTVKSGTETKIFFNTQVFSAGYIYSLMTASNVYLGAYFNVYTMFIYTGLEGDGILLSDQNMYITLPLPNVGILAIFRLNRRLTMEGSFGFFSLKTPSIEGGLQDLKLSMIVHVNHWLSFSGSYQRFTIHSIFKNTKIKTAVDYDFKGPSLGVLVVF